MRGLHIMVMALCVVVFCSTPSAAQDAGLTGERFLKFYDEGGESRSFVATFSNAWLLGFLGGLTLKEDKEIYDRMVECVIGAGVSPAQLNAIFTKWTRAEPEMWHKPAHIILGQLMITRCGLY